MIQDSIFVAGTGMLAHPVSYLFHLQPGVANGDPSSAKDKLLVIADCRLHSPDEIAAWLDATDTTRSAVLLLCPNSTHMEMVSARFAITPIVPPAALLIRSRLREDGAPHHFVRALQYTATMGSTDEAEANSAAADKAGRTPPPEHPMDCDCTDFEALGKVFVSPEAVDSFKLAVEHAMEGSLPQDTEPQPPTGLKYILTSFTSNIPFTYSQGGKSNKGAGSADFTWTVWGFLFQSASENKQILYVGGALNLSAGTLYSNDDCDRGFGNTYLTGTLNAPSPFTKIDFDPSSGSGSWSGSMTIPISYKSPTGGYQIWNFDQSFSNSVSSWDVKSVSSGNNLGAMWWMTSPCDGSNVSDQWKHAFSTWGHVGSLTGASSGSLDVNSMAAWQTTTLQSGNVYLPGNFGWQGARFWGSSCSPGMYWKINAGWTWYSNQNPGFTVNFASLQPS